MSHINWPDDSIFELFDCFEEIYETISSRDIKAAVLIPKNLKSGIHSVIINIHGGFFATAHSLFAPFFAPWTMDLALSNGAIIVSKDYRLLPTPNGVADQLEDLENFWQWTRQTLPTVLERRVPGYALDFDHLLLTVAYPAFDLKDDIFVNGPKPGGPTVLRFPAAEIPSKEGALAWVEGRREIVASKGGFEITPYAVGLAQHGDFFAQMFEHGAVKVEPQHLLIERVKNGARLPKNVWIIQGDDDSVVYLCQSEAFVAAVRESLPAANLRFDIAKGQDHAFDIEPACWEPYAEPAMKFVKENRLQ